MSGRSARPTRSWQSSPARTVSAPNGRSGSCRSKSRGSPRASPRSRSWPATESRSTCRCARRWLSRRMRAPRGAIQCRSSQASALRRLPSDSRIRARGWSSRPTGRIGEESGCRCAKRSRRRVARRRRSSTSSNGVAPIVPGAFRWEGTLPPREVLAEQPTFSPTRRGRPAGRRARYTSRADSSSRSPARPRTADIHAGDRVLFATDMGWIMGPWTVVGAGALGAAVVYMEGAPDWPEDRIWRLVETERVTMLGVSPTLVRADPEGRARGRSHLAASDHDHRRALECRPVRLAERARGRRRRIPIVNISGGTEVGACFLSVTPMAPTKPCSAFRRSDRRWRSTRPRANRYAARWAEASSARGPGRG